MIVEKEAVEPGLLTNEWSAYVCDFVCYGFIVLSQFEREPVGFTLNMLRQEIRYGDGHQHE